MNKQPLVSIITPAYNCKKTFKETYASVIAQSFTNWEWIIVDDCSNDGTFNYLKDLAKENEKIKIFQTEKNNGTAAARNIALKKAIGKYFTFLDSDDILDNNYLEKQVDFIRKHGPLVSAGYRRKAECSCTNFFVPNEVDYKKDLKGNPLSCLTTMFDRDAIGELFFDETYKHHEDYVFWLTILKKGITAIGNPEVLATYVIHKNSKNFNKFKLVKSMYRVYHESQGFNWFKSWIYVFRYALYSKKKYRGVK